MSAVENFLNFVAHCRANWPHSSAKHLHPFCTMEIHAAKKQSTIPEHLRPFFRSKFTTEPLIAKDNYSYTTSTTSPTKTIELCPPRWRLPPKRRLHKRLKDILLKDWQHTNPRTPSNSRPKRRPSMMRMKDSDDYITARAANPWTGLISPSIGTDTPRTSLTPETPGEALKVVAYEQPPSPTPGTIARPTLRRANEGRKISAGSAYKWRAGGKGWFKDPKVAATSPKVTQVKAETGQLASKSLPELSEDQFVVHMPSRDEPQPYVYPGYSAKQIKAYEHYRDKSRRGVWRGI